MADRHGPDAFGNALGNSIVDGMQPTPVTRSNGIGVTEEQHADMNRQVEAGYLASQTGFNSQVRSEVRQQQFQMSLQRDIERSLSNNPKFFANLPAPRAEFETDAFGSTDWLADGPPPTNNVPRPSDARIAAANGAMKHDLLGPVNTIRYTQRHGN